MLPRPLQDPVPFWAGARWPNSKPLARAARLQGCFPIFAHTGQRPAPPSVAELTAVRTKLTDLGAPRSLDLVVRCSVHLIEPRDRAATLAAMDAAGVTWLLEAFKIDQDPAEVEAIVAAGPPGG